MRSSVQAGIGRKLSSTHSLWFRYWSQIIVPDAPAAGEHLVKLRYLIG